MSVRHEVMRFIVVGGVAAFVHVTIALTLAANSAWREELINIIGFLCGATVSYIGHSQYTFGVNSEHSFQVPRFAVLSALGLLTSTFITWLVCTYFDGPIILAMALVVVIIPMITFVGMKLWVFAVSRQKMGQV